MGLFHKDKKVVLSEKQIKEMMKKLPPKEQRKFEKELKKAKKQSEDDYLFDAFCLSMFFEDF